MKFDNVLGLLLMILASTAFADDFFGDQISAREKYTLSGSMERWEESLEALEALKTMLLYQSFSEGRCEGYFEIENEAKKGDSESQWILSDLYRKGYCVPQDDKQALYWVHKAANGRYEKAFFDLGLFLLKGIGGPKNAKSALGWLEKAKSHRVDAYRFLSKIYLDGEGVPQNYQKALDYALEGASYGEPYSQALATLLLSESSLPFHDTVIAYKWGLIAKASGNDNVSSMVGGVMSQLESSLSAKQVAWIQNEAMEWSPRAFNMEKTTSPTEFDLPVLAEGYSKHLSSQQAQDRLRKLGLDHDRYVFFKAIAEDNLEVTRLYVRAGASVDTFNPLTFRSPLIHAAFNGSRRVVAFLVSDGANINSAFNEGNDTAVLLAISSGHREIAEFLISKGANLEHPGIMYNAVEFDDPEFLGLLHSKGVPLDTDYVGTPLSHALAVIERDSTDMYCKLRSVRYLIEKGVDVNFRSETTGKTPLDNALGAANSNRCIELLLRSGARMEGATELEPMLSAVTKGNADLVQLFLEYGADPNQAFRRDADQIPMLLKDQSKDLMTKGGTLLHLAVSEQHSAIARTLIRGGANPRAKDELGRTPLSLAEKSGNKVLLSVFKDDVSYDTGAIFAQCVGAFKSAAEYAERKGEKSVAENYMGASRGATIAARYMFNTHILDEGHEPDAEAVSDLIENIAYGMYIRINSLWGGSNGDEIDKELRTCVEYNELQAEIVQALRKASIGGK